MKKNTLLLIICFISALSMLAQTSQNGVIQSTIITFADGIEVSVEEVKQGDLLLTLNEDGTQVTVSKVVAIEESIAIKLKKVTLANGGEIIVTPDHAMLSDKGWVSSDSKVTSVLEAYKDAKVQDYKLDTFLYTLSPNAAIELLPIVEVEDVIENTPVYRLILDSASAYIANGVFVGQ